MENKNILPLSIFKKKNIETHQKILLVLKIQRLSKGKKVNKLWQKVFDQH